MNFKLVTSLNKRLFEHKAQQLITSVVEMNYPLVLVHQEKIIAEVTAPSSGGVGVGSAVNFQILGDTDIV